MFTTPLDDHAQLRPLEPWQAPEFLAHIDRARPLVDPWIPWASLTTDLASARTTLQRYADLSSTDSGRIYGIWRDGVLVGGVMFTRFDAPSGVCELGCWLEEAGQGHGLVTRACRALIDWAFTERGMTRVEWWVAAGNTRSIASARRLGMSREGVLRQRYPHRGLRHDSEVWSVLAQEWPPAADRSAPASGDRAEIDRLTGLFMDSFTNTGGKTPDLRIIHELFVPEGRIVSNTGDDPVIMDVDAFVEPRQKMLTDGTLTDFSEWEVVERTDIFGSVAHRSAEYRKSGVRNGVRFEGHGHKTTQFLRTRAGWRMVSMAWDDEPDRFPE
ncbi:GNAT family N-acetyltransferase [Streptomyces sp. t39]|uniref:GNAT family N-acetyltransferase n=1 Tax=Streptomyces sp. t39 TaxID=1828156 RepID=UPI0011CE0A8B|nr:GNAT family protein [Streptomyces sp. t39]TXS44281.1 N-acetyltransferase [Streptomyces sp. t39]